ncbi:MAG: hypothetical protein KIS92_11960 [Planctomycetota bacterium]|nr:hypothetical protein [Planctomycetota bacterium]
MGTDSTSESQLIAFGYFERMPDGRWAVDPKHPECSCVEGAAALQDPAHSKSRLLANCQVCANWNPRVGCALGHNLSFDETKGQREPIDVVVEQAQAWVEIGRFDRAIIRVEAFLRGNVENAEAYRALARVYDHPSYKGKDKRRAMVLYKRYLDLKGEAAKNDPKCQEAAMRIMALNRIPPEATDANEAAPLATFNCFHRQGGLTHFFHGVLTYDVLVLAYIGDADPETGVTSVEMGQGFEKATLLWRRIMGEKERDHEKELTLKEYHRVARLPLVQMVRDHRNNFAIAFEQVRKVSTFEDARRSSHSVVIQLEKSEHELVFPSANAGRAQQVAALAEYLASPAVRKHLSGGSQKPRSNGAVA